MQTGQFSFFENVTHFSKSYLQAARTMSSSGVLKYTRADLATLTYHPVRPLDVISKEVNFDFVLVILHITNHGFEYEDWDSCRANGKARRKRKSPPSSKRDDGDSIMYGLRSFTFR